MINFNDMFKNLNHTLKGKDDYFFLVNDKTNEIRQHYDESYNYSLDISGFVDSQNSKKNYLEKKGINYGFFLVPDKSVILRDHLPFDTSNYFYRYADQLGDSIDDLSVVLTKEDYLQTTSDIQSKSFVKIVAYILSQFNEYDYHLFLYVLRNGLSVKTTMIEGDLLFPKNWSYDFDSYHENLSHIESEVYDLDYNVFEVDFEDIPDEFREFVSVKSRHVINGNSFTQKKLLLLYDLNLTYLLPVLSAYYREIFVYRDYNYFNKELIDWYKPDDVIEIRLERYLDKIFVPVVSETSVVKIPVSVLVEDIFIKKNILHINLKGFDGRNMPLTTELEIYVDDELCVNSNFVDGYYEASCDVGGKSYDTHDISILVKAGECTKAKRINVPFKFYEDIDGYFDGLLKTMKGIGDSFFLVNDSNNEIRQHYDRNYKSDFNKNSFIKSQKSKMDFFSKKGIPYKFFIVPDKSIILKNYLPFDTSNLYRHVNDLKEYVVDLLPILDEEDILINDTHVNPMASLKIVPYIFSIFHGNTPEYYENLIKNDLKVIDKRIEGNLFLDNNWSYAKNSLYEKYREITVNSVAFPDSAYEVDLKDIPEQFRCFNKRPSFYMKNPESISDKRVLIFHASSILNMRPLLATFYREIFCYWDYSHFNKEIVEWFNPDEVFELRIERFLEHIPCPILSNRQHLSFPVVLEMESISVIDSVLNIVVFGEDYRGISLDSSCQLFVDDIFITEEKFSNYRCEFNIDVFGYKKGEHVIKLVNKESENTRSGVFVDRITF